MNVAENPSKPEGRRIDLKVAWVPAGDESSAPDPIVYLPGTAGHPALESWAILGPRLDEVSRKRPVLLIDQRGTGGSTPLDCPLPEDTRTLDAMPERAIALIRQCASHLSAQADLRHYTTTDAVRDLEAVREAMELPHLNLLGISYGTRIAQHYARRHPQHVRSMVLGSPLPNGRTLLEALQGSNHTLKQVSALCMQEPECAIEIDDLGKALNTVLNKLEKSPASVPMRNPVTNEPIRYTLTREAVSLSIRELMASPTAAALAPTMVARAARGEYEFITRYAALNDGLPRWTSTRGLYYTVTCAEDVDKQFAEPAPKDDPMQLATLTRILRTGCQSWPRVSLPADFHQPLRSNIPTLAISGDWDSMSSPEFGPEVIAHLKNSRNLLLKWEGYNALLAGCMPNLIATFLDDLDPAGLDASCLQEESPPIISM